MFKHKRLEVWRLLVVLRDESKRGGSAAALYCTPTHGYSSWGRHNLHVLSQASGGKRQKEIHMPKVNLNVQVVQKKTSVSKGHQRGLKPFQERDGDSFRFRVISSSCASSDQASHSFWEENEG